jgi:hypothetical protein
MKLRKAHLSLSLMLIAVIVCLLIGGFEWNHYRTYGHFVSYGLHLDPVSRDAYIGIPGQSKMYSARLTNYSLRSVVLPSCDYVTDAFDKGTEYPYAVQRLDASSNTWQTVSDASGEWFCRPYPLGKAETHLVSRKLAPGESVEIMEGEATGAVDAFHQGDSARFVVFTKRDTSGDWNSAIPSAPFRIEDNVIRDQTIPVRVEH